MVRMVRMVRSLADRTFQLCRGPPAAHPHPALDVVERGGEVVVAALEPLLLLLELPPARAALLLEDVRKHLPLPRTPISQGSEESLTYSWK